MQRKNTLTVPDKHMLRIARSTMTLHCLGARLMGGCNHPEAVATIRRLTGKNVPMPNGCTC